MEPALMLDRTRRRSGLHRTQCFTTTVTARSCRAVEHLLPDGKSVGSLGGSERAPRKNYFFVSRIFVPSTKKRDTRSPRKTGQCQRTNTALEEPNGKRRRQLCRLARKGVQPCERPGECTRAAPRNICSKILSTRRYVPDCLPASSFSHREVRRGGNVAPVRQAQRQVAQSPSYPGPAKHEH